MGDTATIAESTGYFLWFLSEIFFKWVPGVVVSMIGGTGETNTVSQLSSMPIITEPVSVPQTVAFLQANTPPGLYDNLYTIWADFVIISMMLSLTFGAIAIYSLVRLVQIRRAEYRHFEALQHTVAAEDTPKTHLRWKRIEEQVHSDNEQAWRLAILEADIMLNELLDIQGYRGETMADKMRQAEKTKFNTIDIAWEAHRARNRIAHEGAAHHLSGREARHVISQYEKVFREFKVID
ncbi:MAG: hypothetical protein RIQ56_588 [Candidatus Parcubacteria bacterium]|jgi:hypothetical protein